MSRSEESIQKSVVTYARSRGCVAIKLAVLSAMGVSGWPDYFFLAPGRRIWFVEFKRAGGQMTPLQADKAAVLKSLGFVVHLVDNVDYGRLITNVEMVREW